MGNDKLQVVGILSLDPFFGKLQFPLSINHLKLVAAVEEYLPTGVVLETYLNDGKTRSASISRAGINFEESLVLEDITSRSTPKPS